MNQKISINQVLQTAAAVPNKPRQGEPAPPPVMVAGQQVPNAAAIHSVRQHVESAKK